MRHLPNVTLCAIDTRTPHLAVRAMKKSMAQIEFGDYLLVTSSEAQGCLLAGIRVVEIPSLDSKSEYSAFILKRLIQYLQTSHVLIVQWDGFVLYPDAWDNSFLQFDYIGAPWPKLPAHLAVGNGGFSLRSRRLFEAIGDANFVVSHPEDICICLRNRALLEKRYALRFAPLEVASRFSYEQTRPCAKTFGFHGFFNFADFMAPAELHDFLQKIPSTMLCNQDTKDLIVRLLNQSEKAYRPLARALLRRHLLSRLCNSEIANILRSSGSAH